MAAEPTKALGVDTKTTSERNQTFPPNLKLYYQNAVTTNPNLQKYKTSQPVTTIEELENIFAELGAPFQWLEDIDPALYTTPLSLLIKYCDDEVGHIVITLSAIPKSTFVGSYEGDKYDHHNEHTKNNPYCFNIEAGKNKKRLIDAKDKGSFTRLLPYLPLTHQFVENNYDVDKKILSEIAIANLEYKYKPTTKPRKAKQYYKILFYASQNIPAYTILGYGYLSTTFNLDIPFNLRFFNSKGDRFPNLPSLRYKISGKLTDDRTLSLTITKQQLQTRTSELFVITGNSPRYYCAAVLSAAEIQDLMHTTGGPHLVVTPILVFSSDSTLQRFLRYYEHMKKKNYISPDTLKGCVLIELSNSCVHTKKENIRLQLDQYGFYILNKGQQYHLYSKESMEPLMRGPYDNLQLGSPAYTFKTKEALSDFLQQHTKRLIDLPVDSSSELQLRQKIDEDTLLLKKHEQNIAKFTEELKVNQKIIAQLQEKLALLLEQSSTSDSTVNTPLSQYAQHSTRTPSLQSLSAVATEQSTESRLVPQAETATEEPADRTTTNTDNSGKAKKKKKKKKK